MASRLITPVLEEILKSYPLYSQDGKGKDAVCVAIFFIGHVWKSHVNLTLLAKQDCPLWLQYD